MRRVQSQRAWQGKAEHFRVYRASLLARVLDDCAVGCIVFKSSCPAALIPEFVHTAVVVSFLTSYSSFYSFGLRIQ